MSYSKATIYFFTGTGNSYRVAAWMAGAARDAEAAVTICPIEAARPAEEVSQGDGSLLGLTMPTHGLTAPWAMLRFALRLPRGSGTHAVVVATRAGLKIGPVFMPGVEGSGPFLVALILALKGYRIRGAAGVDMPSNWIAVHPGLSPGAVTAIVDRARARVADFVGAILSGRRRFHGWLSLLIGLCLLPLSLSYLVLGRPFLAKLFFASERCTGCGLCAQHCPNNAIKMRGIGSDRRPYWTLRCESCMRCMAYCPTQAVEAYHLLGVGAYFVGTAVPTAALLTWLTARVPALGFLSAVPRWALEWIYAMIALIAAYPLFHLLLRVPWISRFFTVTAITHYFRRYHEPGTSLRDLG